MAILYINARCRQILHILLNRHDYMSMEQLAGELKISRRSAYYDVCKINVWLEQAGVPPLEVERGHGLLLPFENRVRIEELILEHTAEEIYVYSPDERVKLIILYIVYSQEPVYVEQLIDCCEVGRNTIFNDMKDVTARLKRYDLDLNYSSKRGYEISGNPIRVRALFILYFREMLTLYRDGVLKFFDPTEIENHHTQLHQIEAELGVEYVDGALQAIAALLPVMFRQMSTFDFPGLKREEWINTQEFQRVKAHFSELVEDEMIYLTLHLLGSQVNTTYELVESASYQEITDMARALVSEFERIACIVFEDREAVEQALTLHLKTSLYRYQYGIQIGSMFYDDVKNEYPELFAITKMAAKRLESSIELPIPDEEVACIALHFGAFLKIEEPQTDLLRILIVCVNGISTGNMLKREIQKLLPYAEIVDVVAAVDLLNAQNICNLIVSTIKVNSVVPVITVHPVLTEYDRHAILSHRLVAPKTLTVQRDRLFQVVKKYVDPANYENLLNDLAACLQGGDAFSPAEVKGDTGLLSILDVSRVLVQEKVDSWRNSIRMAGKYLLDNGSIRQSYLDTIISQLNYYGPYMFLTDDVILAHAKPEDGVNCLDISLAIFRQPVAFSPLRKAKIVIVLAAEDQEKHLKILQDILVLVSTSDSIESLTACESPAAVLACIGRLLAQADET